MQTWAHWDHGISIQVSLQKKWGDGQLTLCYLLVYKSGRYLEAVNTCAKLSMMKAITEVKALPHYAASGEVHMCTFVTLLQVNGKYYCISQQWVITDARHDSTSNAFHTTVPCLSGR